eukprot:5908979-Pleurochrysis_carterae.AAC.1
MAIAYLMRPGAVALLKVDTQVLFEVLGGVRLERALAILNALIWVRSAFVPVVVVLLLLRRWNTCGARMQIGVASH